MSNLNLKKLSRSDYLKARKIFFRNKLKEIGYLSIALLVIASIILLCIDFYFALHNVGYNDDEIIGIFFLMPLAYCFASMIGALICTWLHNNWITAIREVKKK